MKIFCYYTSLLGLRIGILHLDNKFKIRKNIEYNLIIVKTKQDI
ncbi:hypothetical protein MBGDC06_00726, partial [Thermoplasmatales archaeon SCGC AB-539-C06]